MYLAQSLSEPKHKPPTPEEDSYSSQRRNIILAARLSTVEVSTQMMDTPATLRKHPASSLLNAKARQPTASVGSISPPRAQ